MKILFAFMAGCILTCVPSIMAEAEFSIATFSAEVTVPMGHGMMGGAWKSKMVADPLYAKGVALFGDEAPVVFVSVDWCEIRNEAYDQWRDKLAAVVGTTRERILVSAVHQHEAPVADLEAQRILERLKLEGSICDLQFHEKAVEQVALALKQASSRKRRVTHLGLGQAKVRKIASNRRYELPDGKISFNRFSASARNVLAANAPEGTVDPWLKTLSFWEQDQPVAALSGYAVHPMSYYHTGEVSADFPGMARARRQAETPDCLQVYFSGASGNVTAGKYNTGARANRKVLADRLHAAMKEAWENTRRLPLKQIRFRNSPVRLEPRNHPGFTVADLKKQLVPSTKPFQQCLAAMGSSWRKRADKGQKIDLPVIDLGPAQLLLLPGESYVEYQLAAQRMRPDSFVLVAGYGECAVGYVPTEKHWEERDRNLNDWCWVHPGAEKPLLEAIRKALAERR
ncbi:MAG: neutral/alkaline non-lysosomal ceramidase N-terminal domain-containing protein [Opitutales bacterium]